MPQFRFNLQRVLDYKQQIEDKKKQELAVLITERIREERILFNLNENLKEQINELRDKQQKPLLSIYEILSYYRYIARLEIEIDSQIKKIEIIKEKINKKREELIQAAKEKRVLERLKERRYKEYQLQQDKEEQKFLDQIGTSDYIRGKRVKV